MLSNEEIIAALIKEGFSYFPAAENHLFAHDDLRSESLKFSPGYGLGMLEDLEWWIRENVPLFPLATCQHYDLYLGKDGGLYAVPGYSYGEVYKLSDDVRYGLERVAAGNLEGNKQLIQPVRTSW